MATPHVSLIIPTYNRPKVLARTLIAAGNQTMLPDQYEIIVVDDGSAEAICPVVTAAALPNARCIRQENQGATVARNAGALAARGNLLVFLDDDICLQPPALAALAAEIDASPNTLVMGRLIAPPEMERTLFHRMMMLESAENPQTGDLPYVRCQTGLLAVRCEDFMAVGMFQDPTGGWPNWDDVDFGYRAHLAGLHLCCSQEAIGEHWDYALTDWLTAARRWARASYAAATLFQRYPEIQDELPMFRDMTPIEWDRDTPGLIGRKVVRRLISIRPITWSMERLLALLEAHYPSPALLRPLYRWVNGSYIYHGYHAGLKAGKQTTS